MPTPLRTPKRIYSGTAVELWFRQVQHAWESQFDADTLAAGRALYKDGNIDELELTREDAIIHCKFDRKDTAYAIIQPLANGRFDVRGSSGDDELSNQIAVAGLYEIEELLMESVSPVAADIAVTASPTETEDAVEAEPEQVPETTSQPKDRLKARIDANQRGLILSAEWHSPDGKVRSAFARHKESTRLNDREQLVRLTGLAHEAGFRFHRKEGIFTLFDVERIPAFLSHTLPRWRKTLSQIKLTANAKALCDGVHDLEIVGRAEPVGKDEIRLHWRARIGSQWLPDALVTPLLRHGRGAFIIPGTGIARIRPEQSEVLRDWRERTGTSNRFDRYRLFALDGHHSIRLDLNKELQSWREQLLNPSEAESSLLPKSARGYQREGVRWLVNLRERGCHGLLADEMGLGKTLQSLALVAHARATISDGEKSPVLIVCPASVLPVWEAETLRWYPHLTTRRVVSNSGFGDSEDVAEQPDIWLASYTQLRRHRHALEKQTFDIAILDEAQNIKNPEAKVTQACCAIRARSRYALTGTPLENRLRDLWTLFRFLMPGLLPARHRFEAMEQGTELETRMAFIRTLRRQLAPFVLRRTKEDVLKDLPKKLEMPLYCPLLEAQQQLYTRLLDEGLQDMDADPEAALRKHPTHLFALLTRLRQVCCDPGLVPGHAAIAGQSGKTRILIDKIAEALESDKNRKIVIFSQFVEWLQRLKPTLRRQFPKVSLFELTGSTRDRAEPVENFQQSDGPAVFLVSLKAGGTGITLHAADYVFLLDPWWNPAVEQQAIDRVHRLGQNRPVFVYRLVTKGTIEERIQQLQSHKKGLSEATTDQFGGLRSLVDALDSFGKLALFNGTREDD
jgi:SNF2 family DNA or RNA helicase